MTSAQLPVPTRSPRRDGWTPQRRRAFLDHLASGSNVRRAAARVRLSREGAYSLRRRDAEFSRAWDAAVREARVAEERAFVALLVERCPWARSAFPEACEPAAANLLPLDSVTPGPLV